MSQAPLTLTIYPDPLLRRRAESVPIESISSYRNFAKQMITTMFENDGVGLAAPQVGASLRLIVVSTKDKPLVLFNPKLSKLSFRKEQTEEGCLSIPGVYGTVKRHRSLRWEGYDEQGAFISGTADGLFARVLQHEVDHINGVLFIDRVTNITRGEMPATADAKQSP